MTDKSAQRLLLTGTALLLVGRLSLTLLRTGPLLVADEIGYLTNARVLAGGTPSLMGVDQFYRGGYSLLLTPLLAIDGNPETSYKLVLGLNAVLAAALAPLLYLLLTRCFRTPPSFAVWPALAAAAYPSATVLSQAALSENLLFPLIVLWLICFAKLLDARTTTSSAAWGIAFGACAIALLAVHGRMVTATALTAAALVVLALRRRLAARSAALALAAMGAGYALVRVLNDFLVSTNYGGQHPNEAGQRLSSLGSIDGVLAVGRNLAGQTWYLMVATLGVLVMFVLAGGLRELPRIRHRNAGTPELVLGLLVATGGALLVVSALSFRDLERADMLIYGRYVEVVVPPLLAIALAKLSAERLRGRLGVLLAVMTVATAAVVALRLGVHPPRAPNRWNVASLPFLTLSLGPVSVLGAGAVATAATAALAVLVRRVPATLAPVLLALFIPTTAVGEHNPVLSGQRSVYPSGWISPERTVDGARKIAYDLDHYDVFGRYAYQWFLPHSRLVLFSSAKGRPPAEYVITSHAWPARDRRFRAERVWEDPGRDQAIFRVMRVP